MADQPEDDPRTRQWIVVAFRQRDDIPPVYSSTHRTREEAEETAEAVAKIPFTLSVWIGQRYA